ncbi:MAG: hypothetical protein V8S42_09255 [Lachnospiraceae bacterium]
MSVCIDAKSVVERDKISYNLWGEIPGESDEAIIVVTVMMRITEPFLMMYRESDGQWG